MKLRGTVWHHHFPRICPEVTSWMRWVFFQTFCYFLGIWVCVWKRIEGKKNYCSAYFLWFVFLLHNSWWAMTAKYIYIYLILFNHFNTLCCMDYKHMRILTTLFCFSLNYYKRCHILDCWYLKGKGCFGYYCVLIFNTENGT